MNTKPLICTAVLLALAACDKAPPPAPAPAPAPKVVQAPPPPATRPPCKGTCDVTVNVAKNGANCTVTLSPDDDVINVAPDPAPTIIKWTTSDPSFKFASPDGIVFKPAAPPSPMQNGQGGGRAVTVTDNHTGAATKGRWSYSILVTDGTASCRLDPSVDNN